MFILEGNVVDLGTYSNCQGVAEARSGSRYGPPRWVLSVIFWLPVFTDALPLKALIVFGTAHLLMNSIRIALIGLTVDWGASRWLKACSRMRLKAGIFLVVSVYCVEIWLIENCFPEWATGGCDGVSVAEWCVCQTPAGALEIFCHY